jgi:hypothetical protein
MASLSVSKCENGLLTTHGYGRDWCANDFPNVNEGGHANESGRP